MKERKPNGFWKYMNGWDLVHYARSQYYGDTLNKFRKSAGRGYEEAKIKKIKNENNSQFLREYR